MTLEWTENEAAHRPQIIEISSLQISLTDRLSIYRDQNGKLSAKCNVGGFDVPQGALTGCQRVAAKIAVERLREVAAKIEEGLADA